MTGTPPTGPRWPSRPCGPSPTRPPASAGGGAAIDEGARHARVLGCSPAGGADDLDHATEGDHRQPGVVPRGVARALQRVGHGHEVAQDRSAERTASPARSRRRQAPRRGPTRRSPACPTTAASSSTSRARPAVSSDSDHGPVPTSGSSARSPRTCWCTSRATTSASTTLVADLHGPTVGAGDVVVEVPRSPSTATRSTRWATGGPGTTAPYVKSQLGWLQRATTVTATPHRRPRPVRDDGTRVQGDPDPGQAAPPTGSSTGRAPAATGRCPPARTASRSDTSRGQARTARRGPGQHGTGLRLRRRPSPNGSSWTTPERVRIAVTAETASVATVAINSGPAAPRHPARRGG